MKHLAHSTLDNSVICNSERNHEEFQYTILLAIASRGRRLCSGRRQDTAPAVKPAELESPCFSPGAPNAEKVKAFKPYGPCSETKTAVPAIAPYLSRTRELSSWARIALESDFRPACDEALRGRRRPSLKGRCSSA